MRCFAPSASERGAHRMTVIGWLQALVIFGVVCALVKPIGAYMARVFEGERVFLSPVLVPVERAVYRVTRVDPSREMSWKTYAFAVVAFSLVSFAYLYALLRLQAYLPLNPQGFGNLAPDLAWNTAISFMTNTNWQFYSGESTLSYLSQMAGLAWHNFVSAGAGIAIAIAIIRGLARRQAGTIGNFWVDLTRATLYVLLPISVAGALLLCWQGVPMNFHAYPTAVTLEGAKQSLPQGPIASQEIIKELGTNGGGFLNANSAHPYENPTPLTNLIELVAIFAISSGLTYTLGRMTRSQAHGWAVWSAMVILFLIAVTAAYWAEARGNPLLKGTDQRATVTQSGGNMEGKEVRFGIANSALWAVVTTDTSCGAVNSMHDSFTPLGGLVPLANMMLGEVVFGGVGSGMYGVLVAVILSVFIAGLMVGRTPEYLGKKIEAYDVKMAMLYTLVFPLAILGFTAISVLYKFGTGSISNPGPHGLSQILYAFTEGAGNNGSAFAGLNANTLWYNSAIGLDMLIGRFLMIVPILAIAGNLARKKIAPASAGTFPVTTPTFTFLLISVIVVVGALTFFPVLSLGPILEHLLMRAGTIF